MSKMSKTERIVITFFLGWSGLHRFIDGKIVTGLLWLFTGGCFGIGWFVDFIIACSEPSKPKQVYTSNRPQKITNFEIAGLNYYRDNFIPILEKSNPNLSKFVYRKKTAEVGFVAEPENPHDPNALAIYMEGVKIGYVPADLTGKISSNKFKYKFIGTIYGGDINYTNGVERGSFKGIINIHSY